MTSAPRVCLMAMLTVLFGGTTSAQIAAGREAGRLSNAFSDWTFYLGGYGSFGGADAPYGSSTLTADSHRLHLEARYNYENLKTGSLWTGYNFTGGRELVFQITPMFGVAFGKTTGAVPGYEASVIYKKIEFYSEGEYVFSTKDKRDNFFYAWTEARYSPVHWCHVGLVDQNTKAHRTAFDGQRGVLIGFKRQNIDYTTYAFLTGAGGPSVVLALSFTF